MEHKQIGRLTDISNELDYSIDTFINDLKELKEEGATMVCIGGHAVTAYKVFDKEQMKAARIKDLQDQIDKINAE